MARTAIFTVTLSEPSTRRTSVAYRTVDVTATTQEYYTPSEGTLIFEPGEVTKTIPAGGAPKTNYEEPHAAALLLRACMWLKLSGKLNSGQLDAVNSLGKRCFDYIELRYRKSQLDPMRFTWANDDQVWYGFWHFEIIATFAYLLKNPTGIPSGINTAVLRQRLVETQSWLVNNVR